VRELVNTLERTLAVAGLEHILYPKHLPEYIRIKLAREGEFQSIPEPGQSVTVTGDVNRLPTFKAFREKSMDTLEAQYLKDLLTQAAGGAKEALAISGLGKSRFYELMKKHNLTL